MSRESAYIRGDQEINALRSGDAVSCPTCKATPGVRCRKLTGLILLYNHKTRREAGKLAADALVIARGRARA